MLTITRGRTESFFLHPGEGVDPKTTVEELFEGQSIEVKILRVSGNNVTIGIGAPQKIAIVRKELLDRAE